MSSFHININYLETCLKLRNKYWKQFKNRARVPLFYGTNEEKTEAVLNIFERMEAPVPPEVHEYMTHWTPFNAHYHKEHRGFGGLDNWKEFQKFMLEHNTLPNYGKEK